MRSSLPQLRGGCGSLFYVVFVENLRYPDEAELVPIWAAGQTKTVLK
jgi:hypothetical protein